jgi:hypothetical protein
MDKSAGFAVVRTTDGMITGVYLKDIGCDPLPEEEQTGRKFEFAYDDENVMMNVIDPANVPGPYDKVYLPLAWTAFRIVDDAMGQKARKGQVRADKIAQRAPNLSDEGLAVAMNDMRGSTKMGEVYLAWHRFWAVRHPDAKVRKQSANTIPELEARIAAGKNAVDTLMKIAGDEDMELPTVQ